MHLFEVEFVRNSDFYWFEHWIGIVLNKSDSKFAFFCELFFNLFSPCSTWKVSFNEAQLSVFLYREEHAEEEEKIVSTVRSPTTTPTKLNLNWEKCYLVLFCLWGQQRKSIEITSVRVLCGLCIRTGTLYLWVYYLEILIVNRLQYEQQNNIRTYPSDDIFWMCRIVILSQKAFRKFNSKKNVSHASDSPDK